MKAASPGRPRQFDRTIALKRAMNLFWARGYEGVSLKDLQEAMGGITATSFYAAFESKEALFREAVEMNMTTTGCEPSKELTRHATARASIDGLLRASTLVNCLPGRPTGCMVVLGATNCTRANRKIQEYLKSLRQRRPTILRQRLQRGMMEGDLPKGLNIEPMVSFYTTILSGLSMQARDGASKEDLLAAVDLAMGAWDQFVGKTAVERQPTLPQSIDDATKER